MRLSRLFASLLAAASLGSCATLPAAPATQTPAAEAFVIAANPLATAAGLNVLKRGGSAVDAAIAVQAMLSLVEPQSSGMGGGAFMTYFDGRTGKVSVLDGREVAPAQATSTMFLRPDGSPLPFDQAVVSGRATGVREGMALVAILSTQLWHAEFVAASGDQPTETAVPEVRIDRTADQSMSEVS